MKLYLKIAMRDLDNRLCGVFTLLDGTASKRRAPLVDDGNIKRMLIERRPWAIGESSVHVTAEIEE